MAFASLMAFAAGIASAALICWLANPPNVSSDMLFRNDLLSIMVVMNLK